MSRLNLKPFAQATNCLKAFDDGHAAPKTEAAQSRAVCTAYYRHGNVILLYDIGLSYCSGIPFSPTTCLYSSEKIGD